MNRLNLPWVRQYQGDLNGFCLRKLVSGACLIIVMAAMSFLLCMGIFEAVDKTQADIEESYQRGRRDMRLQILKANQDILKGQELYIRQMDALIEKEYRSKR